MVVHRVIFESMRRGKMQDRGNAHFLRGSPVEAGDNGESDPQWPIYRRRNGRRCAKIQYKENSE